MEESIQNLLLELLSLRYYLPTCYESIIDEINKFVVYLNHSNKPDELIDANPPPKTSSIGSILYRYCVGLQTLIEFSKQDYSLRSEIELLVSSRTPKSLDITPSQLPKPIDLIQIVNNTISILFIRNLENGSDNLFYQKF